MQEEILTRLDALTEKLGVAAQELFAIYVRQAPLEFADVVGVVIGLAVVGLLFKYSLSRMAQEDQFDDSGWFMVVILSCIALLIFGVFVVAESTEAVKAVLNPEYYAITHLGQLLR